MRWTDELVKRFMKECTTELYHSFPEPCRGGKSIDKKIFYFKKKIDSENKNKRRDAQTNAN